MKNVKRVLAVFLIVLTLFTCIPLSAFAVNQNQSNSVETQTTYADDTGMGKIINNLTDEKVDNNSGYVISDLTVKDKIATVKMNVLADCTLVVAVYDEDTLQMLGSGTKQVEFDENIPEYNSDVELEIDTMPENFLAKAFLLNENNHALCKEFTCNTYTTMYQEFLNTTPDDFKDKEIVEMDENQDDFGVLNDGVVSTAFDEKMTYTYNAETGTYVFKNAIDEIKKLKVGDVFYYVLSEELGDFLLFKVKEIKVNASTVTIVEDEDISLADAFQFLRIDEDADFNEVDVDENELGSALEIDDSQPQKAPKRKAEVDKNESKSFSTSLKVSYPKSSSDDKNAWSKGWKISGKIGYTLEASMRLYYDVRWGKDFYEFKTELKHTVDFKISVTGTISLSKDKVNIPIGGKNGIPIGIFNLYIKVYPIVEFSGNVDLFSFKVFSTNKVSINDADGLKKDNTVTKAFDDPKMGETKITIKLGIGVEAEFGWKKGKKDSDGLQKLVASVSINVKVYLQASLKPSLIGVLSDKLHECIFCLDGGLNGVIEGTVSAKLKLISKKLSWSWDAISLNKTFYIGEMYISISPNGIKIGMGNCPHIYHKVTAIVKNSDGKPIEGATVLTETGRCDADGDGKYNDKSMKTNKDGLADFYFNKGNHSLTASHDSSSKTQSFKMIENEKNIEFILSDKKTGDFIYFGNYPQSKVTDSTTLALLNETNSEWQSYEYYSGPGLQSGMQMNASDYMKYRDVWLYSSRYSAVRFTHYRPANTGDAIPTETSSKQGNNGYYTNNTYWFKYEPLKWRVLDPGEGLIMCESIVDSQAYQNTFYNSIFSYEYYQDSTQSVYANDYANSSIRKWLNDDFYNTAFSSSQKANIKITALNNDCNNPSLSEYNSMPTNDKIFLLSYDEAQTDAYGFSSDKYASDAAKKAQGTDYAKCQGLWVYKGYSWWWLRSPASDYRYSLACLIDEYGESSLTKIVN